MKDGDLKLYRQALTCRHSNFGIAAVAYLRRIVENRTNYLVDVIAEQVAASEPDSPLLARVEEVKRDRRFSEKIEFAAAMLPASVRRGGQNPVAILHDLTSEGLHAKSDEECIDMFDRCQLAFEHVITSLKSDSDEDKQYAEALKKLTEKATKGK